MDRNWQFSITHRVLSGDGTVLDGLTDRDVSILAGLIECRDFLRRVRSSSISYDECECPIDEIVSACGAIDRAIAGYVEYRLMYWGGDEDGTS